MHQGKTIAFSTKANVWKTRYSFTPTCYMDMDNDFLSSNTSSVFSNDMLWRHDVNETYNSFYGKPSEPSSIEVVSNDNPSAVKIFKSLSIESSTKGWTGSVYTNKDRGDEPMQTGDFHGFTEKEGNQYSAMPRSVINSSSNITFLGMVNSSDLIPPGVFNNDGSWDIPLTGIPSVSVSASGTSLGFFGAGLASIDEAGEAISGAGGFNAQGLKIIRYNEETNSIALKLNAPALAAVPTFMSLLVGGVLSFNKIIPVYIMTNPIKDGDGMRGPYAGIKLTLPDSSKAFELFAINVDYEKTKLDGSLG
jgi:hypothetical protein